MTRKAVQRPIGTRSSCTSGTIPARSRTVPAFPRKRRGSSELRLPDGDDCRRRGRRTTVGRPQDTQDFRRDTVCTSRPRRRLPLPGLPECPRFVEMSPHRTLGRWRSDVTREPRAALRSPPSFGTRGWIRLPALRERRGLLHGQTRPARLDPCRAETAIDRQCAGLDAGEVSQRARVSADHVPLGQTLRGRSNPAARVDWRLVDLVANRA